MEILPTWVQSKACHTKSSLHSHTLRMGDIESGGMEVKKSHVRSFVSLAQLLLLLTAEFFAPRFLSGRKKGFFAGFFDRFFFFFHSWIVRYERISKGDYIHISLVGVCLLLVRVGRKTEKKKGAFTSLHI